MGPSQPQSTGLNRAFAVLANEEGRIGYIVAWLMGVPASLLLLIFLIRGH